MLKLVGRTVSIMSASIYQFPTHEMSRFVAGLPAVIFSSRPSLDRFFAAVPSLKKAVASRASRVGTSSPHSLNRCDSSD
jgi:hypothetical protein